MRVVVVGGGIAGLAAAWEAVLTGHDVVVLEAEERLGGKIRTTEVAGLAVDEAADAFITRTPAALELCGEVGVESLVAPSTGRAFIWARGQLRPIPEGTVLGVPTDLEAVAATGLLTEPGLERARTEPELAHEPLVDDTSIGSLVRSHFGDEVADYLVDPLLGGINAGGIDNLSLDVAAPQISAVARRHASLLAGLAEARSTMPLATPSPPVFQAPPGGMETLVGTVAAALIARGATIRTSAPVTGVEPAATGGWRLFVDGPPLADERDPHDREVAADAVVLAAPASVSGGLLAPVAEEAAHTLRGIDHASVVLITLAYRQDEIATRPDGSGFLVPKPEGRFLTACSWFSNKWKHLDDGIHFVARASAGRFGDAAALDLDDDDLVQTAHAEIASAAGLDAAPVSQRVSRWGRAFPQFRPGHLALIERLEASLDARAPGLALAGAYLRGVGIPACIAGGRAAAARATAAAPSRS